MLNNIKVNFKRSIGVLLLFIVSIQLNSTAQVTAYSEKEACYDAFIVPGVPHDGETWSQMMNLRVSWSVHLYKTGVTNNIIFSGSSVYSAYNEAKIMALYAEALGVPSEHIFLDTNAEHSTENVYYSFRVAKSIGLKKVALTTDPFQNRMVGSFIKKHKLPIVQFPFNYQDLDHWKVNEPEIDTRMAFNSNFVSIKEQEGFFKRLSGTFGRNIKWHENDLPSRRMVKKYKRRGQLLNSEEVSEVQ